MYPHGIIDFARHNSNSSVSASEVVHAPCVRYRYGKLGFEDTGFCWKGDPGPMLCDSFQHSDLAITILAVLSFAQIRVSVV